LDTFSQREMKSARKASAKNHSLDE
jgi:hypothetical protein